MDLSSGVYSLEDVRTAIENAQGYSPWLASYIPTSMRLLMPYDMRMMFKCEYCIL
jgi:hypothetical protein